MKRIRTIIIGVICIGLVVGYYYYLNHKSPSEDGSDVTEVQKIVLKDLEGQSYPATPRQIYQFDSSFMGIKSGDSLCVSAKKRKGMSNNVI